MGYGVNNDSGLDLFTWGRLMGFNPWHLAQVGDPSSTGGLAVVSQCSTLVYERAANNAQRVGRSEIRRAIEDAEQQVYQYRHAWPAPRFRAQTFQYPTLGDRRLDRLIDAGSDGRWLSITLDEGEVQALGPETEAGATTTALTFTDEDGDGYFETATCTAALPAGTAADEVVVRFLAADCGPITPRPNIAPRAVTVAANGTATITLDTWALVRPEVTSGWAIYNGTSGLLNATVLPPNPASPFAASVEAVRVYANDAGTTEATAAALLIYETRPCPWAWASCCGPDASNPHASDPGATATVIARAGIRDARAGVISVGEAVYNAADGVWVSDCCDADLWRCYPPDRVVLRYQAGTALDGVGMRADLAAVVARLAAANLTATICGCDTANRELYHWQFDTSRSSGTNETFALLNRAQNPLGPRRGALYAWGYLTDQQRLRAISAG